MPTRRPTSRKDAADNAAVNVEGGKDGAAKLTAQKARRVYTDQEYIDALYRCNGLIARVARELDCSREAIYQRAEKSPAVNAALQDSRKYAVDVAEDALHKRVEDGDTTAIIFLLKTLGKSRGYIERQEMTGADGKPMETKTVIEVKYVNPNTDR